MATRIPDELSEVHLEVFLDLAPSFIEIVVLVAIVGVPVLLLSATLWLRLFSCRFSYSGSLFVLVSM